MHINDDILTNDRASQSKFLDWAHRRISQEIQDIEFMEKEYGTAEWYLPEQRRGRKRASDEEKRDTVARVDKLREEGYTYRLACECCNVLPGTYTKWKNYLKKQDNEGVKGTRLSDEAEDAGSTPATSTIN